MIDKQFLVDIVENFCYNIIRKDKKGDECRGKNFYL